MTTTASTTIEDRTIPAGAHSGRVLRRGQTLRIVDLEGRQAVDSATTRADPSERYTPPTP